MANRNKRLSKTGLTLQDSFYRVTWDLETQGVGVLAGAQGELSLEVLAEQRSTVDGLLESSVDGALGGLAGVGHDSLVGGLGELLLAAGGGVRLAGEEIVVDGGDVNTVDIDLGGGGNDEGLVEAAERDTVDGVRAANKKKAAGELLQEDNALATEATREHDEDGAGCDGLAKLGGLGLEVAVVGLVGVLSRVPAAELLLGLLGLGLLLSALTEVLEAALQLDHLGSAEAVDTAGDLTLLRHGV